MQIVFFSGTAEEVTSTKYDIKGAELWEKDVLDSQEADNNDRHQITHSQGISW